MKGESINHFKVTAGWPLGPTTQLLLLRGYSETQFKKQQQQQNPYQSSNRPIAFTVITKGHGYSSAA